MITHFLTLSTFCLFPGCAIFFFLIGFSSELSENCLHSYFLIPMINISCSFEEYFQCHVLITNWLWFYGVLQTTFTSGSSIRQVTLLLFTLLFEHYFTEIQGLGKPCNWCRDNPRRGMKGAPTGHAVMWIFSCSEL